MAYVDKARVEGTLYDISPSPTGNLDSTSENAYTSSDVAQASATTWTNVNPILATEQHRSIFSKLTSMIKNIRYLYNIVGSGTFAPGNGTTVTDVVNNKAPKSHTHTAAQLPTSNSQINSTSYVPTSALIYSMNQTLNSLNDALEELEETAQNIVGTGLAYEFTSLADADEFSQLYNHENHYKGLKIGQSINIIKKDLQYSRRQYVIVGFDLEANNLATDGTSANNGYGVYLITPTWANQGSWSDSATVPESYINSDIRYWISRDVYADEYRAVIGDHLVKRNVLLSSSVDSSSGRPNGYTWTQEYITCPTMCNMTGDSNIDDGELNFQLPLCKSSEGIHRLAQDLNYYFWSRNIYGIDTDSYFKAWQYQVRYDYRKDYYYFNPYKREAAPSGGGTAIRVVLQMIMIK